MVAQTLKSKPTENDMAARFLRRTPKGSKPSQRRTTKENTIIEGEGYVPVTPAGTPLLHLEANTEEQAWKNLMIDAAHMPYVGKPGFVARGYTVESLKQGS
jgi:hypothetical protein